MSDDDDLFSEHDRLAEEARLKAHLLRMELQRVEHEERVRLEEERISKSIDHELLVIRKKEEEEACRSKQEQIPDDGFDLEVILKRNRQRLNILSRLDTLLLFCVVLPPVN